MDFQASISIFRQEIQEDGNSSKPIIPQTLWDAVERVIINKSSEIIKTNSAFYVVEYSSTGPFSQSLSSEWLPVHIYKLYKWTSGGIKVQEMDAYLSSKRTSESKE